MEISVTIGGDYYENIIAEGARGWRVGPKQAAKYVARLAELEELLSSGKKIWNESSVKCEVKELKLKLEHWVD